MNETIQSQTATLSEEFFHSTADHIAEFILACRALPDATPYHRLDGFSGYTAPNLEVGFAPLLGGGFLVKKLLHTEGRTLRRFDLYSTSGTYLTSKENNLFTLMYVSTTVMEAGDPIISHLYNTLAHEYQEATQGRAMNDRIKTIEATLRRLASTPFPSRSRIAAYRMGVLEGYRDPALTRIRKEMLAQERESALLYNERKILRDARAEELKQIIAVKKRAHRVSGWRYRLPFLLTGWFHHLRVYIQRPVSNMKGLAYRMTIGNILWFIHTVRSNIGYSIALAIYGPFTFYFITQPMNPHAMWAVGKVRSAVIEMAEHTQEKLITFGLLAPMSESVKAAENNKSPPLAPTPSAPSRVNDRYRKLAPTHLGLLLSSEVDEVNTQSWQDRMSNFKSMQIGLEEGLQFAARMGRIEQMETQLNFTIISESAYRELERYIDLIDRSSELLPIKSDSSLTRYLSNEKERALRMQLYVWDRTVRFMLDHLYILMDASNEQKFVDPYFGRCFVFMRELTDHLMKRYKGLKKPDGFKRVEHLADLFQKRFQADTRMDARLKKNGIVFSQKDPLDTLEMRDYMRRQWEIIYLLQSKAQEASHFGLQAYTWSVRNSLWAIESIHSNKRQELALIKEWLTDRIITETRRSEMRNEITTRIEPLYESLFHAMTTEFVSIRHELKDRLEKDIEVIQREKVISDIERGFQEREDILNKLTIK